MQKKKKYPLSRLTRISVAVLFEAFTASINILSEQCNHMHLINLWLLNQLFM